MQQLKELYRRWSGAEVSDVTLLAGAGSNRQYYRLNDNDGHTVIGVVGTSKEENQAFVYLSRHFAEKHLPVPQILAVADDSMRYLQTDLGGTSLFDAIRGGREKDGKYDAQELHLLEDVIRLLPRIQFLGAEGLDWSYCYPQPAFDEQNVMFDLNYFKYCFLKATGIDFHEMRLEEDFRRMAHDLTMESANTFMYRDFQARNIMLCPRPSTFEPQPFLIDFQGGRRGPFYYDVASFLWQASARYPESLRQHLIDIYYEELGGYMAERPDRIEFDKHLNLFVLFRLLQVLGAYGFRGYFERKKHFIESIPPAIQNLRNLIFSPKSGEDRGDLCTGFFPYPYLMNILRQLVELPQFATKDQTTCNNGPATVSKYDGKGPLVVRVFSFSYKKGIPEDETGNGGGYVFDCRSTHNPGRYEPYKKITGLDEPVIKFLEDDGEILTFLESVYKLADAHVERYMQRGFTSLMFSFGCTGGQHRSVYSAQHLAEHIHNKFGIEVRICHREQNITQTLKIKKR